MDELIKLQANLQNLINNWDAIINKFILELEPFFIDLVHDQLRKGTSGDGNKLDSYTTDKYVKFKKAIGSISSPVADLNLTGDFYEGMTMKPDFEIFSTDWKNDMLKRMWGDDIMEVSQNNLNKLITEQILPELEAKIKQWLVI